MIERSAYTVASIKPFVAALTAFEEQDPVDSWCEACGRKHTMRGQVEDCARCGGNRFVFREPAFDEEGA